MAYGIKHKETVPVCPECGCRLNQSKTNGNFFHFYAFGSKDARGCTCKLVNQRFLLVDGTVTPVWV